MSEPRLLDRVRDAICVRQYSMATERAYVGWIRRFILFHRKRHPCEMGKSEVEAFLTHLAVNRSVSPATQNQALQAILFLYLQVLEVELPWIDDVIRAKPRRRVPVVLNREEVAALMAQILPAHYLPVSLMYGSGLRLMECLRLRVGDFDLSRHTIRIHGGKGARTASRSCRNSWRMRSYPSASMSAAFMIATCPWAWGGPSFRWPCAESWENPVSAFIGNSCFQAKTFHPIPGIRPTGIDGTCTPVRSGRPFPRPWFVPVSTNA